MIHFTSKNFDLLVTPEHDMFVKRRERKWTNKRNWEFIKAKDVINETMFYRSSEWSGYETKVLNINNQILLTEDFAEFMGWWLSEGSFNRNKINISQSKEVNPDKWERIVELSNKLSNQVWAGKNAIQLKNDSLYEYLKSNNFGKANTKYIPNEIKILSPRYLRLFLNAYVLGDGHKRKCKNYKQANFRDEIIYTTSSKRMADDLGELILKVGHRPSYYLNKTKGKEIKYRNGYYKTNNDIWIIRECYSQTSILDPKTGIIKKEVDYNDNVYCVELEKYHTLLARRNGKVTWTGNCRCSWTPVEKEK
jgi:intein/homing endonuclease